MLLKIGINNIKNEEKQKANDKRRAANASIKSLERQIKRGEITEQQGADRIANINSVLNSDLDTIRQDSLNDQKEFYNAQKAINIASIAMDTAVAIAKIYRDAGGVWNPAATAAALIQAGIGVTQAGVVASQSFAFGGGVAPVADTVPALLTPGETVSTPEASDQFGAEINRFNQIAQGGEGGSPQIVVHINATDGASVKRFFDDNQAEAAQGIMGLVENGHLQVAGV